MEEVLDLTKRLISLQFKKRKCAGLYRRLKTTSKEIRIHVQKLFLSAPCSHYLQQWMRGKRGCLDVGCVEREAAWTCVCHAHAHSHVHVNRETALQVQRLEMEGAMADRLLPRGCFAKARGLMRWQKRNWWGC